MDDLPKQLLLLGLAIVGSAAFAANDATSQQIKDWCAAECKRADHAYIAPKNLKNKDSKKLTIIIKCEICRDTSFHNFRPIITVPVAQRKPFETDLYDLETATIEALQHSIGFVYPPMPLKANSVWTMTYIRQPTKDPPTKIELEQHIGRETF